jgi:hypothetical protein
LAQWRPLFSSAAERVAISLKATGIILSFALLSGLGVTFPARIGGSTITQPESVEARAKK